MEMRKFGIGFCGILGVCAAYYSYSALTTSRLAELQTMAGQEQTVGQIGPTVFGDYLNSQFAQQHHDWKRAGNYLTRVMVQTPDDPQVLKRAMILTMGAGETKKSVEARRASRCRGKRQCAGAVVPDHRRDARQKLCSRRCVSESHASGQPFRFHHASA
ncbi:MAG: hypothetical protein IPJ01_00740 [Micavibrio sp.]|nr:hypothetical protein [Micavibrio sp.]